MASEEDDPTKRLKKPVELGRGDTVALVKNPLTDEELKAIRCMLEGSIPHAVYVEVMSAARKIDAYFGRTWTLEEVTAEWKATHPDEFGGVTP